MAQLAQHLGIAFVLLSSAAFWLYIANKYNNRDNDRWTLST